MKYIWNNDSGVIPNVGVFNKGDEVPADVAEFLKNAGYALLEVADKVKSTAKSETEGGTL